MSRRIYITFGGASYDAGHKRQYEKATVYGADEFRVYDDRWLMNSPFYDQNSWIFEREEDGHTFGFGWCSWKPFIIMQEMKRLSSGDVVLYTDADTFPIARMDRLFEIAEDDEIVLFEEQGCLNRVYTRNDSRFAMGMERMGQDCDRIQACGRFQLFRKGSWMVEQFLMEWLTYSLNPLCQFRSPGMLILNSPDFVRHSAEQSVLSNLAEKYWIDLHRTPDQNGWPPAPDHGVPSDDAYPQVFQQIFCEGDRSDLSGSKYCNVEQR